MNCLKKLHATSRISLSRVVRIRKLGKYPNSNGALLHSKQSNIAISRNYSTEMINDDPASGNRLISSIIFEMLTGGDSSLHLSSLQNEIGNKGIVWKTDPRLQGVRSRINSLINNEDRQLLVSDAFSISQEELHSIIGDDEDALYILSKALSHQCVIPDFPSFVSETKLIFEAVALDRSGELATYIPQLAKEDSSRFGISLCTVDGQRFDFGDAKVPFCLQSCIKPIQYAIAVSDYTSRHVHEYIGKEQSGNLFNAITLNEDDQPHNPMINAGALVVCSMIRPELPLAERFDYIQSIISEMAANEYVSFHNAVFQSEKATSYRNYALSYYLKEKNCFPHPTEMAETVDLYLQLCAVKMTCSSGSVASATLANGGVCPLKPSRRVLDPVAVRNTLSLMHSCGMYDYSGVFAFHVGLPAKSGVAGGLMLVVPNVMGIMIWSPSLDERGNSVRGVRFCEEFARHFNFHVYDNLRHSRQKSDPRTCKIPITELELNLRAASRYLLQE